MGAPKVYDGPVLSSGKCARACVKVAVLCTLNNWERDFPCMWHQTHTSTIQTMMEAVSVAREGTNGESSSDSVSTQECAKLHLRASIFPKILWGEHAPLGSAASRFAAGGLRPPKELPSRIFWIRR